MATIDLTASFRPALSKESWGTLQSTSRLPAVNEMTLQAARNETAGAQLWLTARQDFVLLLDAANWLSPLGFTPRLRLEARFPQPLAANLEVFAVGYVEGDDRQQWMESLERSGYAEVPAERPQAVYFRIRIPKDFPPGSYEGEVRLYSQFGFEDENLVWAGAIHLHVTTAALPDPADWSFHLNLWQHCTAIARQHRVALWSEAHFALIDRYYASLARLGQKAVTIIAAEIPWSGQKCYRDRAYPSYLFEHAVIETNRDAAGVLHVDFSKMDRLLELAAKNRIDAEIDLFGLLNIWTDEEYGFGKVIPDAPDAVRVRCYDQQSRSFTYLRSARELGLYLRAIHDHLLAKGMLERVRITADEPSDLATFNASLEFLRQAAPGLRYTAYINHFEFIEEAPPEVSDFVPILPLLCQDPELTIRLAEKVRRRGGRLDYYVCCWPPIPNTFLHSPLVEAELLGWLTYFLRVDGFDRWAFCLWPAEPWQRVSWRAPGWSAGDMYFVLPGLDGAPVETLRYEALRMAVQDYELLKLVERSLPASQAQTAIAKAFDHILRTTSIRDFAQVGRARAEDLYSLEPLDYQSGRGVLLEALDKANAPTAANLQSERLAR